MDFLAILGCDTSLYHSQGGATLLSFCYPNREFGICILLYFVYWAASLIGMHCFSGSLPLVIVIVLCYLKLVWQINSLSINLG